MPRASTPLFLVVALLGSRLVPAFSHEGHDHPTPTRADEKEVYRPGKLPDRIILTWTGDPAHTQAVTWRTDTTIAQGLAQIALAEGGPKFRDKARTVTATKSVLKSDFYEAHYHTVHFTDLAPGTRYAYRVGDGVNWSEWFHFTTASDEPEPFSFLYFGDAQNDIKSMWSRVIREAYSEAPKTRFMIHAGDLISHANRDAHWGEWFAAGGFLNAMVPSIPTPGNHEYFKGDDGLLDFRLSNHWRPQFALPEHGPKGLEETVYSIDYQGVRIISLNSNIGHFSQMPWLEKQLSDNPNRWTIVTFHHPVYSAARLRDNPHLRLLWKPFFDKYRVDLVLQGHDHAYGRSKLLTVENVAEGASARSPEGGTVYVVSVSGPKMYKVGKSEVMQRTAEGLQLYQIIHVDGDELRYEARTAVGDVYDAFTLKKRPGQINELIEAPQSTERRHPFRRNGSSESEQPQSKLGD